MRSFLGCLILTLALANPAFAREENDLQGDDIVRLPGQPSGGEAQRPPGLPEKGEKLVPGGVLLLSFDRNADGDISPQELSEGVAAAFIAADVNADGQLTALEQQAWASSLPLRDDTLANPVRFDPNLDRIVTLEEFSAVIFQLAAGYQDPEGMIAAQALITRDRMERDDRRLAERRPPGER